MRLIGSEIISGIMYTSVGHHIFADRFDFKSPTNGGLTRLSSRFQVLLEEATESFA